MRSASAPTWPVTCCALAAFLGAAFAGILRHEMWRDELEIWLIARDSASLRELFFNMRTEIHPALWYLINYAITRFTRDPVWMQGVHVLIGAASYALVLRRFPLPTWQRVAWGFGYFALYEYTLISRSYGLEFLLAFLFCALFHERRRLHLGLAAILFLLAHTNLFGVIVAANLALAVGVEALAGGSRFRCRLDARLAGSALVVGLGLGLSLGHLAYQRSLLGVSHLSAPTYDFTWLARRLATVTYGYLPIPNPGDAHLWNTSFLVTLPEPARPWVGLVLGLVLLAVSGFVLRRWRLALMTFALGSTSMMIQIAFVWYGELRHHGQVFMLFAVCCWLYAVIEREAGEADAGATGARRLDAPAAPDPARLRSGFFGALVVAQVAAAMLLYAADWRRPFSNARAAGEFLEQAELGESVVVGSVDFAVQPLTAWFRQPIYYPEQGRFGTFMDWGKTRKVFSPPREVVAEALRFLRESGRPVIVVSNQKLPPFSPSGAGRLSSGEPVELLARFGGAIVPSENFFVFRIGAPVPEAPGVDREPGTKR